MGSAAGKPDRSWLLLAPAGGDGESPVPDVSVVASGGRRIPAHAAVLSTASSVLEGMLDRTKRRDGSCRVIRIDGVSADVVEAFLRFVYSGRWEDDESAMETSGARMQILALAHAYNIPWLKRASEVELAARLTADTVVDTLKLARLCNAPRLYLRCMRLIRKDFATVRRTEAWRFVEQNDPWLELDVLQFMDDWDQNRRQRRRRRAEQGLYMELNDAMECLNHICTDGCTEVGPLDRAPARAPCAKFSVCRGLQLLIRHFASCHRKSCSRCNRTWQLLRLHAALCIHSEHCKVPLCMQFRRKMQSAEADDEIKWRILVKKVSTAQFMSALAAKLFC